MHKGGRGDLNTVSFGSQSAKSCLRAFVPHHHHPMFLFPAPTIFSLQGVEIAAFITPYASLCRQRRLRTRPGRQFGGCNPPRSWAVATVVSCLHCRILVTYTLLNRPCSEKPYARPASSEASRKPAWLASPASAAAIWPPSKRARTSPSTSSRKSPPSSISPKSTSAS